jgi:hypothetical protein
MLGTNNAYGPWRASDLRKQFGGGPISLRSVANIVGNQRVLVFLQVRPLSILDSAHSYDDLLYRWPTDTGLAGDLQNAINTLAGIVSSAGSSIVYVASDGQTVGISGTVNSLLNIQIQPLTEVINNQQQRDPPGKGWEDIAQAIAAAGAGAAALAMSGEGAGEAFVVVAGFAGFLAAGIFLGLGLAILFAGLTSSASSGSGPQSTGLGDLPPGEPIVLGGNPDNLAQYLLNELLYLDLTYVPEPGQLPGAGDLSGDTGEPSEPGGDDSSGGGFGFA